jgi:hypothetical protein
MASKTRIILIVSVVVGLLLFGAGILIGHFAIEKKEQRDDGKEHLLDTKCSMATPYTTTYNAHKLRLVRMLVLLECSELLRVHTCSPATRRVNN